MWIILSFFLLFSMFVFLWILQKLFMSDKKMKKRIKYFLDLNEKKTLPRKKFNLLIQMQLMNQSLRSKMLSKKKNEKLEDLLNRSGLPIKPEEYIVIQWISTSLSGGFLFFITGSVLFLFIGAIAGFVFPKLWVNYKRKKRFNDFNNGIQDMLSTTIGSLKAGFSFSQAVKTVVEESDAPIKDEMELVLKDMQYGSSMEEALHQLKERMPSEDLDLMIQAILIQRQVGGNLATVLEAIVQTIRDRNKIQNQIKTLTAQGRLSGVVVGLLPVVVAVLLYLISPDYIGTLFHRTIGIMMIIGGVISGTIGFLIIRKITTIEV